MKPKVKHPYFFSSDDVFAEIDKDADGIIFFGEFIEYFARMRLMGRPKEVYDREDVNRDGIISWDEFSGPKVPKVLASPTGSSIPNEARMSKSSSELLKDAGLEAVEVDVGWT